MRRSLLRLTRRTPLRLSCLSVPQRGQLSNGATVLALPDDSQTCAMGVFSPAGSRFETPQKWQGVSWLLQRLNLKSNAKYSRKEIAQAVYDMSGIFLVKTEFREVVYHTAQCMKEHFATCADFLTAGLLHAKFVPEEFDKAKDQAIKDIEDTAKDPSKVLFEHVHRAAYAGLTVGQPNWPTPEVIDQLTKEDVEAYIRYFWQPDRLAIVVTGAGLQEAVPVLEEIFSKAPQWEKVPVPPAPKAKYVGGCAMLFNTEPPPTGEERFQDKNNTHIGIIFQGLPESDPDFFALAVLQVLLGGGTAFSQGGPGKGMYTKLFRNVVNVYGNWLWGIEAVMSAFSDTGLFGLYSQAPHQHVENQLRVTLYQMATIVQGINEDMLQMAKNQYLSLIFMSCEERLILVEGVGKSWALYNKVWSPDEILERVQRLTVADLTRVGLRLFHSEPTYVVYGNTHAALPYDQVQAMFREIGRQARLFGRVEVPSTMGVVGRGR